MPLVHFVTHPEVLIDPSVPVPDWPLAPKGRLRMERILEAPWMQAVTDLFTSAERKALDAAQMIARRTGLEPVVIEELAENNRSATATCLETNSNEPPISSSAGRNTV